MNWQEEYKRKLVSAEEAIKLVKSGDRVNISTHTLHGGLAGALAARRDELRIERTEMRPPKAMPHRTELWILDTVVGWRGERGEVIYDEKYVVVLRWWRLFWAVAAIVLFAVVVLLLGVLAKGLK